VPQILFKNILGIMGNARIVENCKPARLGHWQKSNSNCSELNINFCTNAKIGLDTHLFSHFLFQHGEMVVNSNSDQCHRMLQLAHKNLHNTLYFIAN
jgi:hypothetical protein